MPKKTKQAPAPGASKSINIKVKSARNPALEFTVSNAPATTTTVQDLKDAVRERVTDAQGNPVALDKIKILYRRKPVPGTGKTVAEVLADEPEMLAGGKEVEFGVMIIGGGRVSARSRPGTRCTQASHWAEWCRGATDGSILGGFAGLLGAALEGC